MKKRYSKNSLPLVLVTVLGLNAAAFGESFKCGNRFVKTGDAKAIVLLRCGEPFFKEVISGDEETKVEQWTYKTAGYRSFVRILTFVGGRLRDIQIGERAE